MASMMTAMVPLTRMPRARGTSNVSKAYVDLGAKITNASMDWCAMLAIVDRHASSSIARAMKHAETANASTCVPTFSAKMKMCVAKASVCQIAARILVALTGSNA